MRGSKPAIMAYMQKNGSITSKEAFEHFGVTRLAACIYDLRVLGYNIETIKVDGTTRFGEPCQYAKYVYKGKEESNGSR